MARNTRATIVGYETHASYSDAAVTILVCKPVARSGNNWSIWRNGVLQRANSSYSVITAAFSAMVAQRLVEL
jgi:hypothetical protein